MILNSFKHQHVAKILALLLAAASMIVVTKTVWASFSTAISLTGAGVGIDPSIDVDGNGVIHAVWSEQISGSWIVRYAKSTDDGATFPDANRKTVSATNVDARQPRIEIDSTNALHVVWTEQTTMFTQPYYASSTNGGSTFSTPADLFSGGDATNIDDPTVRANGDTVVIIWKTEGPLSLSVIRVRSTDNGANFNAASDL